jgi:hypothetical protein
MDVKKAFGVVTALGTGLGERSRERPELLAEVRATASPEALAALLARELEGSRVAPLVGTFAALLDEEGWKVWRSRLLLQAKMVQEGKQPAPGHERKGP